MKHNYVSLLEAISSLVAVVTVVFCCTRITKFLKAYTNLSSTIVLQKYVVEAYLKNIFCVGMRETDCQRENKLTQD